MAHRPPDHAPEPDRAPEPVIVDPRSGAHAMTIQEAAAAARVDPTRGLDPSDAAARAALAGPNTLEPAASTPVWRIVLKAATEPFIILLAAAGIGAVLLGEVRDGLLVLAGLVPIVGADVLTEHRGDRAVEALREATAPRALVRRAGQPSDIAAAGLVPGDVVLLSTGDVVPADLRLVRADSLRLDRSLLTGESMPELASVEPDAAAAGPPDRRSIAFAGTSVVGGRGEGIVVAIGRATEVGRIAGGLARAARRRSPLQEELNRLVRILLGLALGLIAIVTSLGFLRGQPAGENLLAGISAAIAAIPEEPPILLAVILGLGAYRLMRRGVLVRRLNAEEVLGAIDLIVTDKTGTLTRNELAVRTLSGPTGAIDPASDPEPWLAILGLALRAEDDAWHRGRGLRVGAFTGALARAIETAGGSAELDPEDLLASAPVSGQQPFSRTRARRSGVAGSPEEELALGAPEAVLALLEPDRRPITWPERIDHGTAAGERLVALVRRAAGGPWTAEALIGFADPPRDGIRDALRMAGRAGIQTLVVTGDHPATAAAIARAVGLPDGRIVTGAEIDRWDDIRLASDLASLTVVARSSPELKARLVAVARAAGRRVAVTGDGVNDAPALHGADVAVAMGSGTAVAREAADLVLGDDSFATLMFGLAEGRRIVDNVQKGLVFLVSTHVALLGFLLIATIAGFGQPLLPIQILWLELFIDLSTSVAFEREPPEPDLMDRPPRPVDRPLLPVSLLARISAAGGFSAFAALGLLLLPSPSFDHARWLAYTALVCAQVVRAYANRSLRVPVARLRPNTVLLAAGLVVIAIQAAIPLIPPLAEAFRATALDIGDWLLVALVALAPAMLGEAIRTRYRALWVA